MPVVMFRYDSNISPLHVDFIGLAKRLPAIIATALDVPENPDARLKPEDIEIYVTARGPHDVNVKPLEILIFAHDYPERSANLDARVEQIRKDVAGSFNTFKIDGHPGWIWVHLGNTSFTRLAPQD